MKLRLKHSLPRAFRVGCFTCFPPQWRRKRQTQKLAVLALHLTNGKKMLKTKLQVPGIYNNINRPFLCLWFLWIYSVSGCDPSLILFINFMFPFSSHNWNTLFLGTSAVADAIAEKYNTTKSQVLDHVSNILSCSSTFMRLITCFSTRALVAVHSPAVQQYKGNANTLQFD